MPEDLQLRRREDGTVEMFDASVGQWFPLSNPGWDLSEETISFLEVQDLDGKNLADIVDIEEAAGGTPSQTLQERDRLFGATGSQEEQGDLPPRPPDWLPGRPWPPTKFEKRTRVSETATGELDTATEDVEVIDWEKMEQALAEAGYDPQTGQFTQQDGGIPQFPLTQEGRQRAEEFLAASGVSEAAVIPDFDNGVWTIGQPDEAQTTGRVFSGPDGFARAQQLINQVQAEAVAQGTAPPNLRVAPKTLSNGTQVWEIEAFQPEQPRTEPPLSFSEEMDKRQAEAFRNGNIDEVMRLETIRDEVARNPTMLDMGDAASYAARFAETPEEFTALTEAFNESFQRMQNVGIEPRNFVEREGPFSALEAGLEPSAAFAEQFMGGQPSLQTSEEQRQGVFESTFEREFQREFQAELARGEPREDAEQFAREAARDAAEEAAATFEPPSVQPRAPFGPRTFLGEDAGNAIGPQTQDFMGRFNRFATTAQNIAGEPVSRERLSNLFNNPALESLTERQAELALGAEPQGQATDPEEIARRNALAQERSREQERETVAAGRSDPFADFNRLREERIEEQEREQRGRRRTQRARRRTRTVFR